MIIVFVASDVRQRYGGPRGASSWGEWEGPSRGVDVASGGVAAPAEVS